MGHQCAADSCQEPQALLSIEKEKPVHCEATAVFLSSGGLPAAQILEIGLHPAECYQPATSTMYAPCAS